MINVGVAIATVFILICASELLWRHRRVDTEYTRKFVHTTVGTFVAFWPFFLSRGEIVGMSAAFLIVVIASERLKLFQAIHSVQRPTWGELCFALSVGLLAVLTTDKWIYAAALLHMSLADGLAAIAGTKFGRSNRYHVAGHPKSVAGTAVFLLTSAVILTMYALITHSAVGYWLPIAVLGATLFENLAIRGLDNLLIPVYITAVISRF